MIKWFAINNLVPNVDKMNIMEFIIKSSSHSTLHIGYEEKYIKQTVNIQFLGLQINNHLNEKNYIQQLIHKLSEACYAVRSIIHTSNNNTKIFFYNKTWNNFLGYSSSS
jgi:hypothetical protein